MPAVSEKQRRFFGAVLGAKEGTLKNPSDAIKAAAKSISKKDASDFARSKQGKKKMNTKKESTDKSDMAAIMESMFGAPANPATSDGPPIEGTAVIAEQAEPEGSLVAILGKILEESAETPAGEDTAVAPVATEEDKETAPETDEVKPEVPMESVKAPMSMEEIVTEQFSCLSV